MTTEQVNDPTTARVRAALARMWPIDLPTLESGAALLRRVDRKYVVPVGVVEELLEALRERDDWAALDIDGQRLFAYESVYFDTPDLTTYRAHLQRRRRRYKVRVRRYVDSGQCMLEVKRKGLRGMTVKKRRPHDLDDRLRLDEPALSFVDRSTGVVGELPVSELAPVVVTSNHRATLASLHGHARVTIDTGLACGWGDRWVSLRPGYVLLESKSEGNRSTADRILRSLGQRPVAISKYCIGVAALGLDVPSNPWSRTLRTYFHDQPTPAVQPWVEPTATSA